MKCNLVSDKSISHESSLTECPESAFVSDRLADLNMKEDEDLLKRSDSDMFWIGNNDAAAQKDPETGNRRTGKEPEGIKKTLPYCKRR